jgi:hypothetical protein
MELAAIAAAENCPEICVSEKTIDCSTSRLNRGSDIEQTCENPRIESGLTLRTYVTLEARISATRQRHFASSSGGPAQVLYPGSSSFGQPVSQLSPPGVRVPLQQSLISQSSKITVEGTAISASLHPF